MKHTKHEVCNRVVVGPALLIISGMENCSKAEFPVNARRVQTKNTVHVIQLFA